MYSGCPKEEYAGLFESGALEWRGWNSDIGGVGLVVCGYDTIGASVWYWTWRPLLSTM